MFGVCAGGGSLRINFVAGVLESWTEGVGGGEGGVGAAVVLEFGEAGMLPGMFDHNNIRSFAREEISARTSQNELKSSSHIS